MRSWGWRSMMWLMALEKEEEIPHLPLSACMYLGKARGRLNQNKGPHQGLDHASTLISDLLASWTVKNKRLLFNQWYFLWQLKATETALSDIGVTFICDEFAFPYSSCYFLILLMFLCILLSCSASQNFWCTFCPVGHTTMYLIILLLVDSFQRVF